MYKQIDLYKIISSWNEISEGQLIDRCKNSFQLFCKEYLAHLFSMPMCSFHTEAMELLCSEKTEKRLCLIGPRKHGKTTIVISFIIWLLCYRYAEYILFVGANQEMAIDRIEKVLDEIENNDLIKKDFTHMVPKLDKQGKLKKYNKRGRIFASGQVMQARGYSAGIRGELILGKRPDYIFVDDPEKEDVIESPTKREKLRRIFYQSIEYLGSAFEETNIIVTDTLKHRDSLVANLADRDDWDNHKWSAHTLDGTKQVLWDAVFCYHVNDLENWEIEHWDKKGSKRKDLRFVKVDGIRKETNRIHTPFYGYLERPGKTSIIGLAEGDAEKSEIFEQEFLSIPIKLEAMPLRQEYWNYFEVTRDFLELLDDIIFILDPSKGKSKGKSKSDYEAGAILGRLDRKYFLIHAFLERIPIVLQRDASGKVMKDKEINSLSKLIASLCKRYEIQDIWVEDNSMQEIYLRTLMEDIEYLYLTDPDWMDYCKENKMQPSLNIPSIFGWTSKGDKHERITRHLGILMNKGFVFFRKDWRKKYRVFANNVNDFPQSKNDDAPDCLDMGIRILQDRASY